MKAVTRRGSWGVALVAGSLLLLSQSAAVAQTHSAVPVDLEVPFAPTSVRAEGKAHLVYELHLTNFDYQVREITLTRVEVLASGGDTAPLVSLANGDLSQRLVRPGAPTTLTDKRRIAAGMRAVVLVWVTVDASATVPRTLRHRITVTMENVNGERTVEGATVDVGDAPPLVIGPPLRGGVWMAENGPSNQSIHRHAVLAVDGKARIAQRFAIDWVKFGDNGRLWSGDPANNTSWFGYGAEILAVADATVASVTDGVPENTPQSRALPSFTLDNVAGNSVILDLGHGRFAMYAHMQPGGVRVKVGDRVHTGQVLGLVGNSGNSDAPHLHFQVADANSALGAEGLPYVFASFAKLGVGHIKNLTPTGSGWQALPDGKPEERRMEIPLDKVAVRFP